MLTALDIARLRAQALLRRLDFVPPLVARITLGVVFATTGWGKVHNLAQVTSFFTELGIPAPAFHAHLVSYVELIGGTLLIVGLATRLAAIPLLISMAVAIATAQRAEVHGLPDLFGLVEWTYLALLLWLAMSGPGKVSMDHLLVTRARAGLEPVGNAELPANAT